MSLSFAWNYPPYVLVFSVRATVNTFSTRWYFLTHKLLLCVFETFTPSKFLLPLTKMVVKVVRSFEASSPYQRWRRGHVKNKPALFSASDKHGFHGVNHMTSPDYGTGDGGGGPLKRVRVPVAVHPVGFSQSHYGGQRWQGRKVSCLVRHRLSLPHWLRVEEAAADPAPASRPLPPPPGQPPSPTPSSSGSCQSLRCDPREDAPEGRWPMC